MTPAMRSTGIAPYWEEAGGLRTMLCRFLPIAFLVAGVAIPFQAALATPQDYRIVVLNPIVGLAHEAPITVRLVHEPDGAAVTDAIVTPRALKMPMQAMHPMGGKVRPAKPDGKGDYTFSADITMEGDWLIQIEAKVPGESEPVLAAIAVYAVGPSGPRRGPGSLEYDERLEEQRRVPLRMQGVIGICRDRRGGSK